MTLADQGKRLSLWDGRTRHGGNDIWAYLLVQTSTGGEVSSR